MTTQVVDTDGNVITLDDPTDGFVVFTAGLAPSSGVGKGTPAPSLDVGARNSLVHGDGAVIGPNAYNSVAFGPFNYCDSHDSLQVGSYNNSYNRVNVQLGRFNYTGYQTRRTLQVGEFNSQGAYGSVAIQVGAFNSIDPYSFDVFQFGLFNRVLNSPGYSGDNNFYGSRYDVFVGGLASTANSNYSMTWGFYNSGFGNQSFTIGVFNRNFGQNSLVVGYYNTGQATGSLCIGNYSRAGRGRSVRRAFNFGADVRFGGAFVFGQGCTARGVRSMAFGFWVTAHQDNEIAFGANRDPEGQHSLFGTGGAQASHILRWAPTDDATPTEVLPIHLEQGMSYSMDISVLAKNSDDEDRVTRFERKDVVAHRKLPAQTHGTVFRGPFTAGNVIVGRKTTIVPVGVSDPLFAVGDKLTSGNGVGTIAVTKPEVVSIDVLKQHLAVKNYHTGQLDHGGATGGPFVVDEEVIVVQFEVFDYTSLGGATVLVEIAGTPTTLTEGVEWAAATDNDTTAESLRLAIDGIAGAVATRAAAKVSIQGKVTDVTTSAAGSAMGLRQSKGIVRTVDTIAADTLGIDQSGALGGFGSALRAGDVITGQNSGAFATLTIDRVSYPTFVAGDVVSDDGAGSGASAVMDSNTTIAIALVKSDDGTTMVYKPYRGGEGFAADEPIVEFGIGRRIRVEALAVGSAPRSTTPAILEGGLSLPMVPNGGGADAISAAVTTDGVSRSVSVKGTGIVAPYDWLGDCERKRQLLTRLS